MADHGEEISDQDATVYNNPYSIQGTEAVLNPRSRRLENRPISDAPILDTAFMRGVTSFINHKPPHQANCRFDCERINNVWKYRVRAKRPILNGEELYIDYCQSYGNFNNPNFPSFTTQSKYAKAPAWYEFKNEWSIVE